MFHPPTFRRHPVPYTDQYVDHVFSYHAPREGQPEVYETIRTHAKAFFQVINRLVPDGADKADALRSLRNCVMTANAGVALAGGPEAFMVKTADVAAVARRAKDVEAAATRSPYQTTLGFKAQGGEYEVSIDPTAKRDDGYTEVKKVDTGKPIASLADDYLRAKGL
ncbi:hypothetical protein MYRNA_211 [Mycobacterium phage Myrna]|uniref:Acb2/Tad1 hairpin domain-containing protein n=1 Tax=Mycobacterium phage Myrna TaxID=546805 RepID=B5LJI1_9CAUD|nr:gp211 [Mycobacterium phage Myrna]ACH62178.1 hypothetical protein MYRNA_211 [Mycobacterium phage Myrna]